MGRYRSKRCSEEIEMRLNEMDNMSLDEIQNSDGDYYTGNYYCGDYNKLSHRKRECDQDDDYY